MKASNWLRFNDCSMRIIEGTDSRIIDNRVAFIEKTPRVRVRSANFGDQDLWNWAEGPFKGHGPTDPESMEWCDAMLKLLGYELP